MTRLTLTIILVFAAAIPLAAQESAPVSATVVTLGEAIIRVPADRATITVSTETRGETAPDAQARGNAAMKAVQDAVDALKVTGGQVTTTGLYLSPNYDFANNQRTMRGFIGRHTITIRIDDIRRAGEVLAAAVTAGATSVSGIVFSRRDRQTLEQQALKQAVQVARARADALAAGAGRVVDRIVRIAEEQVASERPMYETRNAQMVGEAVTVSGVPVASGEVEVRARVVLTAVIK
jgi:uncharacterized protein YggE